MKTAKLTFNKKTYLIRYRTKRGLRNQVSKVVTDMAMKQIKEV